MSCPILPRFVDVWSHFLKYDSSDSESTFLRNLYNNFPMDILHEEVVFLYVAYMLNIHYILFSSPISDCSI